MTQHAVGTTRLPPEVRANLEFQALPAESERTVADLIDTLKARGLSQNAISIEIGVSAAQLSSAKSGRFGLSAAPLARLRQLASDAPSEPSEQAEEPSVVSVESDSQDQANASVKEDTASRMAEADPWPHSPDADILSQATDPRAEDQALAVETITKAIEALAEDPGAVLTPDSIEAWAHVYASDAAEYERLRHQAKKGRARVAEIDRAIGARSKYAKERAAKQKTENQDQSYTSCTSNTDADSEAVLSCTEVFQSCTSCTEALPASPGALVRWTEQGPRLLIASDAALVVAKVIRGRFAYCPQAEVWHQFEVAHWSAMMQPAPLHEALTRWLYPATDQVGFTPRYQDSILSLLQRANMASVPAPRPGVIPFRNGLLDIATGSLSPITPENAATWSLPYDYREHDDCPRVQEWLLQAVGGDRDVVELLRAFLAALIRGGAHLQRFLHLIGPGGTGKSTFLRLIEALLGALNVVSTDLKELEQNRFESASLYGKRAALITDSDRYGGSVNKLKAITGQDPVRLERKHVQQSGSFIFDGMVILASNEPLATTDYTSGIERRRVTVAFDHRVSEAEKAAWAAQGGEKAVLHAELPGVVNWALKMPAEAMERRIRNPPEHTVRANLDAMCAGNPCADWLTECCVPESGAWTQIGKNEERRNPDDGEVYFIDSDTKLFPSYLAWCRSSGRVPLSLRRFRSVVTDAIKTLGFDAIETRRAEGQGITGVRLRKPEEAPFSWHSGARSYTSCTEPTPTDTAETLANAGSVGNVGSSDPIHSAHARADTSDSFADEEVF